MSSSLRRGAIVGLVTSLLGGGCAGPYAERHDESVVRRFGDRLVEGGYVSPTAYESYIRAMLQENAGRPDEAVDSLRHAIGSDGTSAYLRTRLADALLATGRVDEAREELDAAQHLDPDEVEAFLVKARLCARLRDRAGEDAALVRAIAIDPQREEAYLMLAASQREASHDDRALATMRSLAAQVPSATAEEALGRAALRARDRRGARDHLRRALELDAARNEVRVDLARLALGDGELDLGLQLLGAAAERTREPALSIELVKAASIAGRHAQAVALLDRLEEDAPTSSARLELAAVFVEIGAPRRATIVADAILGDDRRGEVRTAARALLARAAEEEGSPADALAAWQQLGPTDAEYTTALIARARLLRLRGRDREAIALLEAGVADRAARARTDEQDQLRIALALLRADLGDREAAMSQLETLAASRPRALAPRLALARVARQAGQAAKAVALLEPLAKKGELRAMQLLGDVLVAAGQRLDEATRLLERAEGLAPNDAAIADSLGAAYLAAGRLDDAQRLLERADRLAPPDVEVLLHLCQLYVKKDDRSRATAALQRALTAKPDEHARQEIEAQLLMLERGRMGAR